MTDNNPNIIQEFEELTEGLEFANVPRSEVNYIKMPINRLDLQSKEDREYFNRIVNWFKENCARKIVRTSSGGISVSRAKYSYFSYDFRQCGTGFELTIIAGKCCRIQLGICDDKGTKVFGRQALSRFKKELAKDDVNLDDYAIDNGQEINEDIKKPRIKAYKIDTWIEHCHHLDFHKAYMSGLYMSHPEMRTTIQRLYDKRHDDESIKAIFTNSIGMMHSKIINWKFANLAKDAINTFNDKLTTIANKLLDSERHIIAFNTDGIWYTGDVYKDEDYGDNLTQYSNDYTDCKIRFKSDGAYEFWYQDKLYTKLRGRTRLDYIKHRDKDGLGWDEGDIYSKDAVIIRYVVKNENVYQLED